MVMEGKEENVAHNLSGRCTLYDSKTICSRLTCGKAGIQIVLWSVQV